MTPDKQEANHQNQLNEIYKMSNTTLVIDEFVKNVEKDKEYTLTELKEILTVAFNANKPEKKEKAVKKPKEDKPKRAPSAYNNFVKHTMAKLKESEPTLSAKELLTKAGSTWKQLTKQEQEQFKAN